MQTLPSYLHLYETGELTRRIEAIWAIMKEYTLCPRHCRVNRQEGEKGFCRVGILPMVSSFGPHFGEERPLVGRHGSGTIFLTWCNLRCVFCQNYDISQLGAGEEETVEQLGDMMVSLWRQGCHNINFVTPTHQVAQILAALPHAIEQGMNVPLVYNCGGYEEVGTLRLLDGIFDIYMPDWKALLFKYLGGVDAVPICLRTEDPEEIIRTVRILEPSFGGINLEDISQPKCFRILDALRADMGIPVWHDDQQGSATAVLAGLINSLQLVGKEMRKIRIAMIGIGAANYSTYRLLKAAGADPAGIVACDSKGILGPYRHDIEERQVELAEKWRVCRESNSERVTGGIAEALAGADVCLAFSRPDPGIIKPEWIKRMAAKAVVFACANPVPEIWPWDAREAGAAIVATGRTDFPNQVNNSIVFPGIFRGVLDVRARTVTNEMAIAAATELAGFAAERGIKEDNIMPRMDEWEVYPRTAAATALKAQEQGIARLSKDRATLYKEASQTIREAREAVQVLMREGLIRKAPEE